VYRRIWTFISIYSRPTHARYSSNIHNCCRNTSQEAYKQKVDYYLWPLYSRMLRNINIFLSVIACKQKSQTCGWISIKLSVMAGVWLRNDAQRTLCWKVWRLNLLDMIKAKVKTSFWFNGQNVIQTMTTHSNERLFSPLARSSIILTYCFHGGRHCLRSMTHAPETDSRNQRHRSKFDARLRRQFVRCTTSNIIDCIRASKAVNDVRSRASVRKTGARIWRRICFTDFWSRFLEPCVRALRTFPSSSRLCSLLYSLC